MQIIEELENTIKFCEENGTLGALCGLTKALEIVKKHCSWIPYKAGDAVEPYDEYYITLKGETLSQAWYIDGIWTDSINFEEYDPDDIIAYREAVTVVPYRDK